MSKKYDSGKFNPNLILLLCHKCHLNLAEHRKTMNKNWGKNKGRLSTKNKQQ